MTQREDMVMRPRLAPAQRVTNAKGRAPEARQTQLLTRDNGRTGSIRNKILTARAARRIQKLRRKRAQAQRLAKVGAKISRGLTKAGKSAARTPWGAILATVAAAGVVATKAITGRSYDQMAQDFSSKLIGDQDLQAAAASQARRKVQGDPFLLRVSAAGGTTSQLVFQHEQEVNLKFLRGQRMIQQQFQVSSGADDFTDRSYRRVKRVIVKAFGDDSMVVDAARRFVRAYRDSYQSNWVANR